MAILVVVVVEMAGTVEAKEAEEILGPAGERATAMAHANLRILLHYVFQLGQQIHGRLGRLQCHLSPSLNYPKRRN